MLVFSCTNDTTVPYGQQERFVQLARKAGNEVAHIIHHGADHGEGGVYTDIGREAVLRLLRAKGLLPTKTPRSDGLACIEGAKASFGLGVASYPKPHFRWWLHKRSSFQLHA